MNILPVHPDKIIFLAEARRTLAERFPQAAPAAERAWELGWPAVDAQNGGLQLGTVAELCSPSSCGRLFLHQVLAAVRRKCEWAALLDCGRSFDGQSYAGLPAQRLLHVFCASAEQGVKSADLLLRDGNLPLVLLDLQAVPRVQLERIPANTWHRFQRLVERSGTALVVLTPQPIVEAARVRLVLNGRWALAALSRPRQELIDTLQVQVFRRGRAASPPAERCAQTA